MSDTDQLKQAILSKALKDIPFDGWTGAVLVKAGEANGVGRDELDLLFPRSAVDLLEAFSHAADAHMSKALEGADLPSMKIREKITFAVFERIRFLQECREASLRASSFLASPTHAVLTATLLARTVDIAWRGIGDTSTDFNFYSKRATLSLVVSSTMLCWMSDESGDLEPTADFLDRRIENVMQFEKAKAQVKKAAANLPSPVELLAKLRYASSRFKA
jgi:ubiquinone biosynthesis protein COQ9